MPKRYFLKMEPYLEECANVNICPVLKFCKNSPQYQRSQKKDKNRVSSCKWQNKYESSLLFSEVSFNSYYIVALLTRYSSAEITKFKGVFPHPQCVLCV